MSLTPAISETLEIILKNGSEEKSSVVIADVFSLRLECFES